MFVAFTVVIRVTRDRRAVVALFAYVIAVHFGLVFLKRDGWPFATHGVFLESGDESRPLSSPRFDAIDANGREYELDARTWLPLSERTVATWCLMSFRRLTAEERDAAVAYLLRKAQTSRAIFSIAPDWYGVDTHQAPAARATALRILLVTRVPAEKLENGRESSQILAQSSR